jgi:hypothetical protein
MFLLYHSEGCNIRESVLCESYVNDLYTTTCSGVLGHRSFIVQWLHPARPIMNPFILNYRICTFFL